MTHLGELALRGFQSIWKTYYVFAFFSVCCTALLHTAVTVLFATQSAPFLKVAETHRNDEELHYSSNTTACWTIATLFWWVIALAVHYLRKRTSALPALDSESNTHMAESALLTGIMWGYSYFSSTSPARQLLELCNVLDATGYWHPSNFNGSSQASSLEFSQCNLANAISRVSWVGPVAMVLAALALCSSGVSSKPSDKIETLSSDSTRSPAPIMRELKDTDVTDVSEHKTLEV